MSCFSIRQSSCFYVYIQLMRRGFLLLAVSEKEVILLEVTDRGCCHPSGLAGAAGEPRIEWKLDYVPLKVVFPDQAKISFDTCFILYNVQAVTAHWVNRELSFLNLASVILTSLPNIHLRFQAFPGCSDCCQCSFSIE